MVADGQPLLADHAACAEDLLAGLDGDWTVRGQKEVANLMVGTLDNCLTRRGERESAAAVRSFAVGNGVWAHADRQNDGVLVEYPGMAAVPWWDSPQDISAEFANLVSELVESFPALQAEAVHWLGHSESIPGPHVGKTWIPNLEGAHSGGHWMEANIVPLGGGRLSDMLCGDKPLLPVLCRVLFAHMPTAAGGDVRAHAVTTTT